MSIQPNLVETEALKAKPLHLTLNRQVLDFCQKMFIYFWVFSVLGHYLELIWKNFVFKSDWRPIMPTITPLAAPYGLCIVAIILFVKPFIKKHKFTPFEVFGLCTLVSGLVEYFCAAAIVLIFGYNRFWNYSNEPFNINGFVCLRNVITFGVLTTFFIYCVYPYCDKLIKKLPWYLFKIIFWLIFLTYALDLFFLELRMIFSY